MKKLFIGHLPKSVSEEELRTFLSQFCPIEGLHLIQDSVTGELKGPIHPPSVMPRLCLYFCRFRREG